MTAARIRISSGALRGRWLKVGPGIRPTASRVREALIDIWRPRLAGAHVLDLFAGSGAVGMAALSCGATRCTFVEADRWAARELAAATARCGVADRARVVEARVVGPDWSRTLVGAFDLVFADPPYAFDAYDRLIADLPGLLTAGGEVAIEHEPGRAFDPTASCGAFESLGERRYGDSALTRFQPLGAAAGGG